MKKHLTWSIFFSLIITISYAAAQSDNVPLDNSTQSGTLGRIVPSDNSTQSGTLDRIVPSDNSAQAPGRIVPSDNSIQRENMGRIVPFDDGFKLQEPAEQRPVVAVQLQPLRTHQVVIFIDRSLSMSTRDCPQVPGTHVKVIKMGKHDLAPQLFSSRWDWCSYQIAQMAEQARSVLPDGFTVVLFGSSFHIHRNMTAERLQNIFRSKDPWGGTVLGHPLERIFQDYFNQRTLTPGASKPLLIGIITDGTPTDHSRVLKTIVEATKHMRDAKEITIVFFLIGEKDYKGNDFVCTLIYKLQKKGASYNIVRAIPFTKLEKFGLAQCLILGLQAPEEESSR